MGVSAGSPVFARLVETSPKIPEESKHCAFRKRQSGRHPARQAPCFSSETSCSTPISLADCYQNHPHESPKTLNRSERTVRMFGTHHRMRHDDTRANPMRAQSSFKWGVAIENQFAHEWPKASKCDACLYGQWQARQRMPRASGTNVYTDEQLPCDEGISARLRAGLNAELCSRDVCRNGQFSARRVKDAQRRA